MNREQGKSAEDTARVPGPLRKDERRPGLRAIGLAASRLAGPIVARHGGGTLGRLKAEWPAIIGAEFAAASWPQSLSRAGVLKLRVAPSAALELQHRTPLLIERIDLYLGRATISRIVLIQGPLSSTPPATLEAVLIGTSDAEAIEHTVAEIPDPALREALARLGKSVASRARRRR